MINEDTIIIIIIIIILIQVLEITIFVINEVIGRDYIGAVDAGDTIFVHIFGAYFGLTVARSSDHVHNNDDVHDQ